MLSRAVMRTSVRVRAALAALGVSLVALSLLVTGGPAMADPQPPRTVDEAKALVNKLSDEAASIDQDYVAAQERLAVSQKKLKQDQADLDKQAAQVEALRKQVAQIALANFQQSSSTSTAVMMLTSDPADFIAQLTTVQQVSANQLDQLQRFGQEQATFNDLKLAAENQVAASTQAKKDMADARAKSDAKLAEAKKVLASLTAAQQAAIAAQQAAEQRAAAATARTAQEATTTDRTTRTSRDENRSSATTTTVPVSGRAAIAVRFALAQVGKAYVYAGNGPNAYDCSGLTSQAWLRAGVHLPRTSQSQFHVGTFVPESQLQPGDLVFYYGGISHVGMYIGNGMIVHAANYRTGVTTAPLHSMPYMGARRPG